MKTLFRLLWLTAALLIAAHSHPLLADPASAGDPSRAVESGKSGDEWFSGVKQGNWRVSDKISPGMHQILSQVLLDFSNHTPKGACPSAAANAAWGALADVANAGPVDAFLESIKNALGGIRKVATFGADPSAAADMLDPGAAMDAFIKKLKETREEDVQNISDKLQEIWKGKPVEVLRRDAERGACRTTLVAIWDRASSTYEITIYGNCDCKLVPVWGGGRSVALKAFAVRLSGRVTPGLADGELVLIVGLPRVASWQNCECGAGGTGVTPPGGGTAVTTGGGGTTPPPQYDGDFWRKLTTKCPACQPIVDQIKKAQEQRDSIESEHRDLMGHYEAAVTRNDTAAMEAYRAAIQALNPREKALKELQERLYAQLLECQKEKCPPGGGLVSPPPAPPGGAGVTPPPPVAPPSRPSGSSGGSSAPPVTPPPDDTKKRENRLKSIGALRTGQANDSGTNVAPGFGEIRDPSGQAREDAARRANEAERRYEPQREGGAGSTSPPPPSTPTETIPSPTDRAETIPPAAPPAQIGQPSPQPAQPDIAGTWTLVDTSSGVSRVTIAREGNAYVLTGMGPAIMLQQEGNAYIGEGAVLFGKGGHSIRLVPQGNQMGLEARNNQGGRFSTTLRK